MEGRSHKSQASSSGGDAESSQRPQNEAFSALKSHRQECSAGTHLQIMVIGRGLSCTLSSRHPSSSAAFISDIRVLSLYIGDQPKSLCFGFWPTILV